MGELSNKIGKNGEAIIEALFKEYIGYPDYRENLSISCHNQSEHAELRNNKSPTHGIDGLVHYRTPLDENVLEIGFISVKHSGNPYPKYPRSTFKKHFIDLATGLECFKYSTILSEVQSIAKRVKKTRVIGVLFWLSNNEESKNQDLLEELSKSQLESLQIPFDEIIIVDNARLQFIVNSLERIKLLSGNNYQFVYPSTGLNFKADSNENFGLQMPMEFFAYGVLPFRYTKDGETIFHLACGEGFSEETLVQIISLAKNFDKLQATKKITITFPNYNSQDHQDIISKVKSYFDDQEFTNQIKISGQYSDFRNI
ncbi:hypothetical protein [Mesonia sp. K7]|uniref:GapS4a family protein n=1 Tax=Mesonia sp. K7 TaxID=2218606 RepID=UPI000DAA7774|nr:hypothetical protein [Mesonia sp. K7]PZD78533.1 hypothetical protein DNG35_05585 [Mesonia sp. K7]